MDFSNLIYRNSLWIDEKYEYIVDLFLLDFGNKYKFDLQRQTSLLQIYKANKHTT